MSSFIERRIVLGFITSAKFCREIKPIYKPEYMQSKYAVRIIDWCIKYHNKYDKALNKNIESVFNKQKAKLQEAVVEGIEDILVSLSDEYDDGVLNVEFLMEETEEYFNSYALQAISDGITDLLEQKDITAAENLVANYKAVKRPITGWVDPYTKEAVLKSFSEKEEQLFKLPGALGKMMNHQLTRESLIAFLAPEKRGKSFWLMEMAFRAAKSNRKVAILQVGDMTERQMLNRMSVYTAGKSNKVKYCGERLIPVMDCMKNQLGTCKFKKREHGFFEGSQKELEELDYDAFMQYVEDNPDHEPCKRCFKKNVYKFTGSIWYQLKEKVKPLSWKEAFKITQKNRFIKNIRLATFPNDTVSVSMIDKELQKLIERHKFIPDVVIIDYADLLIAEKQKDFRHQQNEIWKGLSRIRQEYKCCLITATQSNAQGHVVKNLDLTNYSEDKRKFAHVTAMYALNQTYNERRKGIIRIGELIVREDEYDSERQCCILQCLQRGKPYICSYFVKKPIESKDKKEK